MNEQDHLSNGFLDEAEERRRKIISERIAIGEACVADRCLPNEGRPQLKAKQAAKASPKKKINKKANLLAVANGHASSDSDYVRGVVRPRDKAAAMKSAPFKIGPYALNSVIEGDCLNLIRRLPEASIDLVVTSPPYWGQRTSAGMGVEEDPRSYVRALTDIFTALVSKLKPEGLVWINLGDAYNTPVNWRLEDHAYSSLGPDRDGLNPDNSAYIKPRAKRKAYIDKGVPWLTYGNLLSLPYRLILALCDAGYLSRGEIIWRKRNPMPEGRCRRPHRQHESIYLLSKQENHSFRVTPPVGSVWEFGNEKIDGLAHFSRFPEELPRRCIDAYGKAGGDVVVLDPFSGSGTTGIAALKLGCSYIGFEIDREQVQASNDRLRRISGDDSPLLRRVAG